MQETAYPKVLIGCPTSWRHQHSIKQFAARLKELSYPNFKVLFVDETPTGEHADYLKEQGYSVIKNYPQSKDKIGRIVENRNVLIKKFIEGDATFLLFLDSDVIPPKDVIERLTRHNTDITAGVYAANQLINNKQKIAPVLRGLTEYKDYSKVIELEDIKDGRFFEIFGCGFGCCLIKRAVLEKVSLRYNLHLNSSEDFIFCYDARTKYGFRSFVDTSVKCVHVAGSGTYNLTAKKKGL